MMTSANPLKEGVELLFADGCRGFVPFADIPEVKELENLTSIELPNPYAVVLQTKLGETVEVTTLAAAKAYLGWSHFDS